MKLIGRHWEDFARISLRLFWVRQVMFIGATIGTGMLLSSTVPIALYCLCTLTELAEAFVSRRTLGAQPKTPKRQQAIERAQIIIGGCSAGGVLLYAWVVAEMETGVFHFMSVFYMISAALNAAMFNHMIRRVLLVRMAIYGSGLVAIGLREVFGNWPVVETEAVVQLIAIVSGAVFVVWNSCEFLRVYTTQRAREAELEMRRARQEDFSKTASDLFVETDETLSITYISADARVIEPVRAHFELGTPLAHFVKALDDGAARLRAKLESHAMIGAMRVSMPGHTGPETHYLISGIARTANNGVFTGYRLAIKDISDLVRSTARSQELAAQLQHSERLRTVGELTTGVAHDFNNILTVIQGNLELVLNHGTMREGHGDEDTRALLEEAHAATARGGRVTRDLLTFARRGQLQPSKVDIVDATARIVGLLSRSVKSSVDLTLSKPRDAGEASCFAFLDPAMLESAILNVAVNARHAIQDHGTISFEILQREIDGRPHVVIEIADTGIGMDPETLRRATDPYFSTKSKDRGSGIGLAVVSGFVEQSGGRLDIESRKGHGTTVRMAFPQVEPPQATENEPKNRLYFGNGERILVVEDEEAVLEVGLAMLGHLGYETQAARSGDEAWYLFEKGEKFDVVLTDLDMPGQINGTELARRLDAKSPNLPVMLVSGYDLSEVSAQAWSAPRDWMQKPVTLQSLSESMARLLEQSRAL